MFKVKLQRIKYPQGRAHALNPFTFQQVKVDKIARNNLGLSGFQGNAEKPEIFFDSVVKFIEIIRWH